MDTIKTRRRKNFVLVFLMLKIISKKIISSNGGFLFLKPTID